MRFAFHAPRAQQFHLLTASCLTLAMIVAVTQPAAAAEKNCSTAIAAQQQAAEQRIDQQKALSLAKAAKDFGSRTKWYKADFNSVYFIHSFDPESCAYRGIESVNVVHALSDKSKHAKNVVTHLDSGATKVNSVSEHAGGDKFVGENITDITGDLWSGYSAFAFKRNLSLETLSSVYANWGIPTIDSPDVGDVNCVDEDCQVGAWVGLYGSPTQLAQIGSSSKRSCTWQYEVDDFGDFGGIEFSCNNSHYLWYEFLPAARIVCSNAGKIAPGDKIFAKVERGRASPANYYSMSVSNLTTGKTCSISQTYALTSPSQGLFIVEPPLTSSGQKRFIPSFSPITMSRAYMTWIDNDTAQYESYNLYNIANVLAPKFEGGVLRFLLKQGNNLNIQVGNLVSGGSFTQTYLTSKK